MARAIVFLSFILLTIMVGSWSWLAMTSRPLPSQLELTVGMPLESLLTKSHATHLIDEKAGKTVTLTKAQSERLVDLLLNDSYYNFDLRKRSLFVPAYTIIWAQPSEGGKPLEVTVSLKAKQLRFSRDDRMIIVDYETSKTPLSTIFEELNDIVASGNPLISTGPHETI